MQKIRNYFEEEKINLAPSERDFAMILSKIEKVDVTPSAKRSPFMIWSFASVSFAAMVLLVVNVFTPSSDTVAPVMMKVAVNQPSDKMEALNTIDSVQSFNIKNDNDF